MLGFLRTFDADGIRNQADDGQVKRYALEAAIEIASLGLVNECNAICKILADHGQFDSGKEGLEFQCIWFYSGSEPPDIQDASGGAAWVPSKEDIRAGELKARRSLLRLPKWLDWDSIDVEMLTKMHDVIDATSKKPHSDATTGYMAQDLSAQYTAMVYLASDLDHSDVIADLMPRIADRIHANQQARYLTLVPKLWQDYLLTGWLRERLSITKEAAQDYASYVLDVVRNRVIKGRLRPEEVFPDATMTQLLHVIDENTLHVKRLDPHQDVEPHSVLHPGATSKQISEAEVRIGHRLPDDMKAFYGLSNGCDMIHTGHGFYKLRFPLLDQIYFEKEDYMKYYEFEIVPSLPRHLKVQWHDIAHGAIATYEHDGQGTHYVWIMNAEAIRKAKEQLQIVYEKADVDDRAIIDRHIRYWYGDREAYDAMTEYCYFETLWGHGAHAVYPSFKSFLAQAAYDSRYSTRRGLLSSEE